MPFRAGVVRLEVPIMKNKVNVGTAIVEDDTITLEFRGGYASYVNEIADMLITGLAHGVTIEPVMIPAKPYEKVGNDVRTN